MADTEVFTESVWVEPSAGASSGVSWSLDCAALWIVVPGLAWHPSATNADLPDVAVCPAKEYEPYASAAYRARVLAAGAGGAGSARNKMRVNGRIHPTFLATTRGRIVTSFRSWLGEAGAPAPPG
jgi:hypothetical protein